MPETCSVDTSPLVYLFRTCKLDLLRTLFGRACVAEAITAELSEGLAIGARVPELVDYPWIEVVRPSIHEPVSLAHLGSGERAAIAVVLAGQAGIVVLDDLNARTAAQGLGVRLIGTAGLLALAKARGLIAAVGPVLDELVCAGMWLSADVRQEILRLAGEV